MFHGVQQSDENKLCPLCKADMILEKLNVNVCYALEKNHCIEGFCGHFFGEGFLCE